MKCLEQSNSGNAPLTIIFVAMLIMGIGNSFLLYLFGLLIELLSAARCLGVLVWIHFFVFRILLDKNSRKL